jgi:hypothetical protein
MSPKRLFSAMPSDCAAFYGVAHGVVSVEVASSEWELKLQDLLYSDAVITVHVLSVDASFTR